MADQVKVRLLIHAYCLQPLTRIPGARRDSSRIPQGGNPILEQMHKGTTPYKAS